MKGNFEKFLLLCSVHGWNLEVVKVKSSVFKFYSINKIEFNGVRTIELLLQIILVFHFCTFFFYFGCKFFPFFSSNSKIKVKRWFKKETLNLKSIIIE